MKQILFILILAAISFGCKKSSSDSSTSEFSNNIQLGTGVNSANPFILTGVGTTFLAETAIYFRLESQDDMAGSAVKIQVNRSNGSLYNSFNYTNPQSYGHIMVSSFTISELGSFTVTGILVNGNKSIAGINITVN